MALSATATGAYFGVKPWLVLLWLGLVPAALVCWILATRYRDLWTAGYAAAWVVALIILPELFRLLGILH